MLDTFWALIAEQFERHRAARSADDVLRILASESGSAPGLRGLPIPRGVSVPPGGHPAPSTDGPRPHSASRASHL